MNRINLQTKLVGEIRGDFIIPSYQRGYRWQEEVKMLLDDIDEIPDGEKYCLQPIVVKKIDDNKFELIDGQQRMTTLFLILSYIRTFRPKLIQKYTIDYEIRAKSKDFLLNIDFDDIPDPESANNIDEYFINEAARTIKKWFDETPDADNAANLIANKLNNKVNVIWYEIDSSEDANSLFTRLNIGKIPLTNAELVKAIFLSRNNGIDERYQIEISTQWDNIERELHDDKFWYFITNKETKNFPTRIELLFDLMAGKQDGDRERLRTFFWFLEQMKSETYKDNKIELWKLVIENFQRLKEWYNDSELYHKIGYLIAVNQMPLQTLMLESRVKGKIEFKQSLNELIAKSILIKKEYLDLSYNYDKSFIEKLLLLFNVESVSQNGDKSMRFPFEKHKNKNGGWSLEHIHAQQSESLNKKEEWNEWLDLHVQSLKNIDKDKNGELIKEIESREKEKLDKNEFLELSKKVIEAFELEQNVEYIDSLSNMALLGKNDNSALNNSTFDVKRDKILEMDKNGDYIPICTRRVFLKYYTPSDKNQIHFWGEADRASYLEAMNKMLTPYLKIIGKEI